MIHICDYGIGNVQSILNAFSRIGVSAEIISDPEKINSADGLIVPGVGAFGDAVYMLRNMGFEQPIIDFAQAGKPVLGICAGMQLLANIGTEFGKHRGLGLIEGTVDRISFPLGEELVLPHMGWNALKTFGDDKIVADLPGDKTCYFAHSFQFVPDDRSVIVATVDYGGEIVACVARGNVFGAQFHPEKSQEVGLKFLSNFAEKCAKC
ncbi:imidazole glycerol phosphate synthase subunit HisH [Thalassospira xiamenensis]|uniref:imidazole glycerol phosphate synthase subunit HisH n=1 Tax=Thalassospira xiamenensis TaxID=220697 RepID=UPI000DED5786|nr:imidazole glycerol phosphate synthase subunit HisH [Thalassospira xiamenensis]RCK33566.1 hypothetical protein TH24_21185 [Thalassospira xiamenensis]